MTSIATTAITFISVFGAVLCGIRLGRVIPKDHLSVESKDTLRMSLGLMGTMVAPVLGLLVASSKAVYDAQSAELTQVSAQVIWLDRTLAQFGPEARDTREILRAVVVRALDRSRQRARPSRLRPVSVSVEILYQSIQQLPAQNNVQRSVQAQALTLSNGLAQTRWLMYAQMATPLPPALIFVLLSWLSIIFIGFGLFAPPSAPVIVSLFVAALSVSGAIFIILEMYNPYGGVMQISTAPVEAGSGHASRRCPTLYQINTRVLLTGLSRTLKRPATLDDILEVELDRLARNGFDWVWFLGVWQTGASGRKVSLENPEWQRESQQLLSEFSDQDVCGSCFAIRSYEVHSNFGGNSALERLRRRFDKC
jgi:hypothetical protein